MRVPIFALLSRHVVLGLIPVIGLLVVVLVLVVVVVVLGGLVVVVVLGEVGDGVDVSSSFLGPQQRRQHGRRCRKDGGMYRRYVGWCLPEAFDGVLASLDAGGVPEGTKERTTRTLDRGAAFEAFDAFDAFDAFEAFEAYAFDAFDAPSALSCTFKGLLALHIPMYCRYVLYCTVHTYSRSPDTEERQALQVNKVRRAKQKLGAAAGTGKMAHPRSSGVCLYALVLGALTFFGPDSGLDFSAYTKYRRFGRPVQHLLLQIHPRPDLRWSSFGQRCIAAFVQLQLQDLPAHLAGAWLI